MHTRQKETPSNVFVDKAGTRVRVAAVGVAGSEAAEGGFLSRTLFVGLVVDSQRRIWRLPKSKFEAAFTALDPKQVDIFRQLESRLARDTQMHDLPGEVWEILEPTPAPIIAGQGQGPGTGREVADGEIGPTIPT